MFAINRGIGVIFAALALAGTAAAQDASIETRLGGENFESPPASLDQLDWLVGQWVGDGIRGAPAMESWLAPSGGTMVGTFVQETREDDGSSAIMFTEHMYLMQERGTLVLRLKHFNADLTGWEEKDGMLTFRLVAVEPCAVFFNALTLRCVDAERPGEGLVAAVRMKSDKPEPQELIFTFRAVERSNVSYDCDGTTIAINTCLANLHFDSLEREAKYLQAALESIGDNQALRDKIVQSSADSLVYRANECDAVHENWKDGTIRTAMELRCSIRLTDQRTHTIWRNWLTYQDSTVPILPEPMPMR